MNNRIISKIINGKDCWRKSL